jgi:phage N-6-adenine-methyltransferase
MSELRGKETLNPDRSDNYPTPPELVEHVRSFFGGIIDLDPVATSDNSTGARHYFTKTDDGLSKSWQGFENVYVNPPYERQWYAKIADEVNAGAAETIALLKASPCTRWAQEVILPPASGVCFIKGRLTFGNATSPAGFGSWLIYFGSQRRRFAKIFGDLGWVVPISNPNTRNKK